jgi:roadblock/LC7 domain-containing protein
VWSHQLLNYDEQLSGVPDYMVAKRSAKGKIMFEAKKDNFEEGWGQCLAELITAQKLNQNNQTEIFGIVSNGKFWEFGRLLENSFEKNIKLYTISNLEELFAAVNYVFQKSQSYCLQSLPRGDAPNIYFC